MYIDTLNAASIAAYLLTRIMQIQPTSVLLRNTLSVFHRFSSHLSYCQRDVMYYLFLFMVVVVVVVVVVIIIIITSVLLHKLDIRLTA